MMMMMMMMMAKPDRSWQSRANLVVCRIFVDLVGDDLLPFDHPDRESFLRRLWRKSCVQHTSPSPSSSLPSSPQWRRRQSSALHTETPLGLTVVMSPTPGPIWLTRRTLQSSLRIWDRGRSTKSPSSSFPPSTMRRCVLIYQIRKGYSILKQFCLCLQIESIYKMWRKNRWHPLLQPKPPARFCYMWYCLEAHVNWTWATEAIFKFPFQSSKNWCFCDFNKITINLPLTVNYSGYIKNFKNPLGGPRKYLIWKNQTSGFDSIKWP